MSEAEVWKDSDTWTTHKDSIEPREVGWAADKQVVELLKLWNTEEASGKDTVYKGVTIYGVYGQRQEIAARVTND